MSHPEFSRRIAVDRHVEPVQAFDIEANPAERAALARRFGLVSLDRLTASGQVETLDGGRRAVLQARFDAHVVQTCIVTLDPVPADVSESFALEYAADAPSAVPADLDIDPEEMDPPEPLIEAAIDVGEAVAEHLALALDPYPRAPGAQLPPEYDAGQGEEGESAKDSPFKALSGLVRKTGK
jgi:uncharacterized metal-binding protein YceD (DUF177 family)